MSTATSRSTRKACCWSSSIARPRACGGIVIRQVERIVKAGTLAPQGRQDPGVVIDYVVLSQPQNHMQSIATQFDPRCAATSACPPAACRRWRWMSAKVIARRAAMEPARRHHQPRHRHPGRHPVRRGRGRHGRGIDAQHRAASPAASAQGGDFGPPTTPRPSSSRASSSTSTTAVASASFLGLAQVDASGNVNVSKFNGRPVGCRLRHHALHQAPSSSAAASPPVASS